LRAPENRDALLGVAATAVQKGDYTSAMESYGKLLELDPNDDLALAGISGLKQNVQGAADETLLKQLLQKRPDSAQLHFALGNVYSAAADWPKAQSAYFDAHRNDSQNPDYAYNLAISLEHLRQPETALRYYELAINLSGARKPNFDLAQAAARVSALQSYAGGAAPDAR
jgi:tetratricopeptide (TPR) repeat protein